MLVQSNTANKSKGTSSCIRFEIECLYSKFYAIDGDLVTFCSFGVCFRTSLFLCCFYYDYEVDSVVKRWSPLAPEHLVDTDAGRSSSGRKKTQTAERRTHCAGATLSKSVKGGRRNVFGFCLRISSSLSQIFMLSININDLVVEIWRKDSNWRLVARKPMEIMVGGVQYAKFERWLGTPLSRPSFSLFIKVSLYPRNFKIIFPHSEKLFINIFIYWNSLAWKITRLFSVSNCWVSRSRLKKSNILGHNNLHWFPTLKTADR